MAFTYSWSTIADGAIDPDSPGDTALFTAIRNNITYVYEYVGGKSFTPAEPHTHDGVNSALIATVADGGITEPKLAASAVSQGKLKSTIGTVSVATTATFSTSSYVILPGGEYGLWIQIRLQYGTATGVDFRGLADIADIAAADGPYDSGYRTQVNLTANSVAGPPGTYTAYLQQRYIQASPPYDLGDGPVPLFIFVEMRPNRIINALYVATEAPWHYNGPTCLRPDFHTRDGRPMRRMRQVLVEHRSPRAARVAGLTIEQYLDRLATDPLVDVEITQEMKQRDMPLIPHPFAAPAPGNIVVMLDPMSPIMGRLALLQDQQPENIEDSVSGLLQTGQIIIDNTPCGAISPPGVMAVGCRWKNTS